MHREQFAKALADCFQAVVPDGFHVETDGAMLWYQLDEGRGFFGGMSGSYAVEHWFSGLVDAPPDIRVKMAAEQALDELQDFVDEQSTEPWPGRHTPPSVHAEVRGGMLYMWFGDEGSEDLILQPMDLRLDSET